MKARTDTPAVSPQDQALLASPTWLAMAFRPFFLGAAFFAASTTLLWLHALTAGRLPGGGHLPLTLWHVHEMIFGFTLAVVAGFLLTAARNWTGRNTLHGYPLLGLALLWLLGRIGMAGLLPLAPPLQAVLQIAFPVLLLVAAGRPILLARSRRNYGVVLVLGALALASLGTHLAALGGRDLSRPALYGALHLLILLNVVIGGRVVPLFTRNRTQDPSVRNVPAVDKPALAAAALVIPAAVWQAASPSGTSALVLGVVAAASGALQLLRMRTWGSARALRISMLAVLHVAYAWIGVGQLLLAASLFVPGLPETTAIHALTIGVIGTMTLGMMARVTLGHTGRTIESHPVHTLAFALMYAAVLARLAAAVAPGALVVTWVASGSLFSLAFLLYAAKAWVPLTTPRPDGRPG